MQQVKTLREGLQVHESVTPLVVRAVIPGNRQVLTEGGALVPEPKLATYVHLESLPFDLRERVKTAIQILLQP